KSAKRLGRKRLVAFVGFVGSCSNRDWIAASRIRWSRTGNARNCLSASSVMVILNGMELPRRNLVVLRRGHEELHLALLLRHLNNTIRWPLANGALELFWGWVAVGNPVEREHLLLSSRNVLGRDEADARHPRLLANDQDCQRLKVFQQTVG